MNYFLLMTSLIPLVPKLYKFTSDFGNFVYKKLKGKGCGGGKKTTKRKKGGFGISEALQWGPTLYKMHKIMDTGVNNFVNDHNIPKKFNNWFRKLRGKGYNKMLLRKKRPKKIEIEKQISVDIIPQKDKISKSDLLNAADYYRDLLLKK